MSKEQISTKTNPITILIISIAAIIVVIMFGGILDNKSKSLGVAPEDAPISATVSKNKEAPTITAYIDPLCPRCKEYFDDTLKSVKKEYVDTGKLQLDVRLLSIIAEESAPLVQLSMCANEQGAFWETLTFTFDELYRKNGKNPADNAVSFFNDHSYTQLAKTLGVNATKLESCVSKNTYLQKIEEANYTAFQGGVNSTPTTFIPGTDIISGYVTYGHIKPILDRVE